MALQHDQVPENRELSDREHAELIRGLYRNAPVGVAGALFGVGVLCWVLPRIDPGLAPAAGLWFLATLASAVWQLSLSLWYHRAHAPDGAWRVWARRFVIASFAEGVRWGAGSVLLVPPDNAAAQVWVCMVVAAAASASVSSLGSYIPAFYALLFPAMGPFVVWGGLQPDPLYKALALMAVVLMTTIALLGYSQSRSLAEALRLRFKNLDLVDSLQIQKERAEAANLAKTQFLAAASHDLRQPIHALGMFVAALVRRPLDRETQALGGQIADTVGAMSGLFDSLLDLSQLDAGVVRPQPVTFALQPLLERLCREQAEELRERPVTLRLAPTSAVLRTDPILLERMLRNVLVNAVRQTQRGRILVGVRRRRGRAAVEVWDTGPGIAPEQQQAIFEEYYQIDGPERDRRRGLGLGLAITRRLSHLLDCPITLRSQVGVGSVFRISAPTASAAELGQPMVGAEPGLPPAALVFVVDDEASVREGTAKLLRAWGYDVVAADSAAELMAVLDPARRPAALICDWRLRGQETARDVIAALQGLFGADLPVLLITGDTAPSRLRDAHGAGFVLLQKPVPPGKLRAALGNLSRRAAEAREPQPVR